MGRLRGIIPTFWVPWAWGVATTAREMVLHGVDFLVRIFISICILTDLLQCYPSDGSLFPLLFFAFVFLHLAFQLLDSGLLGHINVDSAF